MNGIRALSEGLHDSYPLLRRRRTARTSVAARLKAIRRDAAVRSLSRVRGEGTVPPAPDPAVEAEKRALRELEAACGALERRWDDLERAVDGAEAAVGIDAPVPSAAVLAELDLLATGAAALHDGFAPRSAPPPAPASGLTAGRAAIAVGTGLALVALGAPHLAVHAAMAASHSAKKKANRIQRPLPSHSGARALERILAGLPRGEPSADAVRSALEALSRTPRDGACWEEFVASAQERVGVLRRAHVRARAEGLLERRGS